jgi:hypothetical protein
MNEKIPTAKIPGFIVGKIILKRIPMLEQPSIFAASSKEYGTVSTNDFRRTIDNGKEKVVSAKITPKYVFRRFHLQKKV